jgi:hypothetical protein
MIQIIEISLRYYFEDRVTLDIFDVENNLFNISQSFIIND